MAPFEKFSDYMFYLLPSPLKKRGHKSQFFLFFQVIGGMFDVIKEDIFKLRYESNVESCAPTVLYVFAEERGLNRLQGESIEGFRQRIGMYAETAALAGSIPGILLAMKMVGYPDCSIEPVYKTNPERWAEINIHFYTASVDIDNTIDFPVIRREIMKVKRASTLPHYLFHYPTVADSTETAQTRSVHLYRADFFEGALYLDGTWILDGNQALGGSTFRIPSANVHLLDVSCLEAFTGKVTVKNDVWYLDGQQTLNGTKIIDSYIKEETL